VRSDDDAAVHQGKSSHNHGASCDHVDVPPVYVARVSQTLEPAVGSGDHDRILLRGLVDADVGLRLGQMLGERIAAGCSSIDLDLSAVESVDEHGLVAIVRAWHEVTGGGRTLRLLDPSPAIGPLLAMSGLTTVHGDA
jgi:anti-anti-sigma regulatory factor